MLRAFHEAMWAYRSKFSPTPEYDFDINGDIICNFQPIQWTQTAVCALMISSLGGAAAGVLVSLAVNTALVEISLSQPFSWYFGAIFIFVGLVIIWRVLTTFNSAIPLPEMAAVRRPRNHLILCAALSILCGIVTFSLGKESLLTMPALLRLIVYSILGMSVAFSLTFALVDLLNLSMGALRAEFARPLVESVLQIYVVITISLLLGGTFGVLFSLVEIPNRSNIASYFANSLDATARHATASGLLIAHIVDPRLCLPIGIFYGSVAGLLNEYLRRLEISFNKLDQPIQLQYDM